MPQKDYIGISQTFPCRWSYRDGRFAEESSHKYGVAGFFFYGKSKDSGCAGKMENWSAGCRKSRCALKNSGLAGTKEFGLIEEYEKLKGSRCRPFNKIIVDGDVFIKEPVDAQGKSCLSGSVHGMKRQKKKA